MTPPLKTEVTLPSESTDPDEISGFYFKRLLQMLRVEDKWIQ